MQHMNWKAWFSKIMRRTMIVRPIAVFLMGAAVGGLVVFLFYHPSISIPQNQHEVNSKYPLVSPLLACGTDQNLTTLEATRLQTELQNAITVSENKGDITTASVYFKDFEGGPWVGINENQAFEPGSLLKVPLAMSVYDQAESSSTYLSEKLDYTGKETDDPQYFKPKPLPAGMYTVQQLVDQMLVYSDNNAANVLANSVGPTGFEDTYVHLGVPPPPTVGTNYSLSAYGYSEFFRILYNATYLDAADSEHLLELLSQTTFNDGLVAGLPPGTKIAHKFGERSFNDSNLLELHDCGIVYAPNHPYLICVMTEGYNYQTMASVISQLSNVTYNYVE
jgi:beta-lactamase class A